MTTVRDLLKDDDKRTVSRTAFGLGVGIGLGFVVGGPVGAGIGALAGGALGALSDPGPQKGEMTPGRKLLFWRAMSSNNPKAILKTAAIFHEAELFDEADLLTKQAALRELPEAEAERRAATAMRALCSNKPAGVEKIASFFHEQGAVVIADKLAEHARDLRALDKGPVDAACVERFEARLRHARENNAPAESIASAESNLVRATPSVQPSQPESAPQPEPPQPAP